MVDRSSAPLVVANRTDEHWVGGAATVAVHSGPRSRDLKAAGAANYRRGSAAN